jgi:hypothetical protein
MFARRERSFWRDQRGSALIEGAAVTWPHSAARRRRGRSWRVRSSPRKCGGAQWRRTSRNSPRARFTASGRNATNVKCFTPGFRHSCYGEEDTKWVLGCEARLKGLVDNRSVQDTPRRG